MLTLSGVEKSHGGRTLFSDVSLHINRGDRLGLVGPNGAGKTTLFNIILDEESPDAGSVDLKRNLDLGFLPQESLPVKNETVLELVLSISPEFLSARANVLLSESAEADAYEIYETHGGAQLEAKAKRILAGLSFSDSDFDRQATEMSGGWVMRAHIARLLVQEPDLLMLDEPTNHLDLEALIWLQDYLKTYPGAILMVSHDREFLNQLVRGILEIRRARLFRWTGNYDAFLAQRDAHETQQLAEHKNSQRQIDHLQSFVDRFRAKNTKATQAKSKQKQIDRIKAEMVEAPQGEDRQMKGFRFPQPERSGQRVLSLKKVDFAYGNNVVYAGMECEVERGQRTVLVGPNGAGKSTLLKLMAGVLEPQSGVRNLGHNVKSGYFSQNRVDVLNPEHTALEEAMDCPQALTEERARTVLGSFLFRGDDVFKRVSVLSGGEKSRLALVKLLLDPPNFLLMDEPTTHLDMASIDALIAALKQYEGTLVFISHDVHFIRQISEHTIHVNAGKLRNFPGGYDYYLQKTEAENARAGLTSGGKSSLFKSTGASSKEDQKARKRAEAEARNTRSRERKGFEKEVKRLEREIQIAEAKIAELTQELEKPETYDNPGLAMNINRELTTVQSTLDCLTPEWEEAAQKLEQID
ncbi:MAG: ABC-F family ATP-binding cassette domain-containing protein [Verrucomicrobiota bacterium]|nr:ABC-F family ATP-binding cassette domain-containing protein [Verrucomicrobiota bacterium]